MGTKNIFCQSCGMPITEDPNKGGTNSDGTKNEMFCSYCYQNGTFLFNGTVEEMQEFCKRIMIEQGKPKWIAWLFTRNMKRLKRWKK